MKKVILILFITLMVFVFDTRIFKNTAYNLYKIATTKYGYRITNNPDVLNKNDYTKKDHSTYASNTDSLNAHNKQELIDIYYSAVNSGFDRITFYCDYECGDDISDLNSNDANFTYINQLVGVYNTYSSIESSYTSNLRVDLNIIRKYSEEDINRIDKRLDEIIIEQEINNYSDIKDKIKVFHDYIANTNRYDQEMAENRESSYHSDTAIGALFEGKSICSGYSDAMSLFLDKLGLDNVRIATEEHVWNAVLIDGTWYHIDLTWDDPIVTNGGDIIQYDYFLITTDELNNKDDDEHDYNKEIYDFI